MSTGNQSYNLASTTGNLFLDIGTNGVIEVRDGSLTGTLLANVSTTDGFTYAVAGKGPDSTLSDSNAHSTTSQTLTFVDPSPSNSAVLNIGATYGQQSVTGVTNHFVDLGALTGATITVSSLFSNLTTADWIWIQGNGNDTVIGGGTKALEIVSYAVASATNQLTTSTSGNTTFIKDGTVTDFTVVNTSGTYTVKNGAGASLATASNVNDLHFFADNGTSAPTNFVDLQVGVAYGGIGTSTNPQSGKDYWINGQTSGSDTISISSLFPSLTKADDVWVQNRGGNDTITNTTGGRVAVGFTVASAAGQLTQASSGGTISVLDGTTTDFTVTQSSGTYTVKTGAGATLAAASGVHDLHFQVQGSSTNSLDILVGLTSGSTTSTTPQGGKFYWVNGGGSGVSDTINVASLFSSAASVDNVFVKNNGGNDTVTNTTSAIVAVGYTATSAANQLTQVSNGNTVTVMDGTATDYTIVNASGTYTVTNSAGATLTTASGIHDLRFNVQGASSNFLDVQVGVVSGSTTSTTPQGGKFFWANGSSFSDTINVSSLFSSATSVDNVFIRNRGGNDTITNTTGAVVAVGFTAASATNQLTQSISSGTVAVLDGTTTDFTVTASSGTYTVKNTAGATLATASGVHDLRFNVQSAGSNFLDVQVGLTTGSSSSTTPQGGKFYWVNGSTFSDTINLSSLFSSLTSSDNVFIQTRGGNETITNTTGAVTAIGFTTASAVNQLTQSSSGNTISVMDGTATDYTIVNNSGTFTVKNAAGATLATASGVHDLRFAVQGSSSNFLDVLVAPTYGSGTSTTPQGGKFYFVNGTGFAETVNLSSLFPSLTSVDNVYIQTKGGNDTITNTTGAKVAVGFTTASATNQLTQAISGGTVAVLDGTATDYTVTASSGTYTVKNGAGTTLAAASGVHDLRFQVQGAGSNFLDVQVGLTTGSSTSTTPQGGKFYWVNGSTFSDTINLSSLFSSLTSSDNVFIQTRGGNETITNTTGAVTAIGFTTASAANQLTRTSSGNTISVMDGAATDYTIVSASGTYTVKNTAGATLATASGVHDLRFQVQGSSSNFLDVQLAPTYGVGTSTTPQGGKFYYVNGTGFTETVNLSSLFPSLTSVDNVYIQTKGGNDTITNTTGAVVAVGFTVSSATSQLTQVGNGNTVTVKDGTATDFTVVNASGTYTVKNSAGSTLATASGVHDLRFQVQGAGSNFLDVQVGPVYGSGTSTTPQGGKFYYVNGSSFAETVNLSSLFPTLSSVDNVYIQTKGGNDTITNSTAALVTVGFNVASAANQLTQVSNGSTVTIKDGTNTDFTVTASSGTYTVTNIAGSTLATASGVRDLRFQVQGSSSNFLDVQVGPTYGSGTSTTPQGGKFYYVNGSSFAETINLSSLFPSLSSVDNVYIQTKGGNDTITNSTAAIVTVSFSAASAVNKLTQASSGNTISVMDGTATDFTVASNSGTFTVKNAAGVTVATASGVHDLRFQVQSATSNFLDVQVGVTSGSSSNTTPQGGKFFYVNGTGFTETIDLATLFSSLTSADNVFIQTKGGNDTITNTTAAVATVGFNLASAANQLTKVSNGNTVTIQDGTTTDFTIVNNSGTFTVKNGAGTTLATASGVQDLHFQVPGTGTSNFADVQTGLISGQIGTATNAQGGHNFFVDGTGFSDTVNIASLFSSLGATDMVVVQNRGGYDTITNTTAATVKVHFTVASVTSPSVVNGSGSLMVMDGTATDFVVTASSGTYTVTNGSGKTLAATNGTANLNFASAATGQLFASIGTADTVVAAQSGNGGTIILTPFTETVSAANVFALAGAGDTVVFDLDGGSDTLTGHSGGPNRYEFYGSVVTGGRVNPVPGAGAAGVAFVGNDTVTNFVSGTDIIAVGAGATVTLSGSKLTFGGNLSGSLTATGATIAASDVFTLLEGRPAGGDLVSAQGISQVLSGDGGTILLAKNNPGTTEFLQSGGGNDQMIASTGIDDFIYTKMSPSEKHSIVNFNESAGDRIVVPVGTTVGISSTVTLSGSGISGTITVKGSTIDKGAIATLLTGATAGGDTVTTSGVTAAGTGGFILQSANGTGTTTLVGGANETLLHGTGAAGAAQFEFSSAAAGVSDMLLNFSPTKGDFIHLATGETFTHASSGSNEVITVTPAAGGQVTITLIGYTDSQFSSNWIKVG